MVCLGLVSEHIVHELSFGMCKVSGTGFDLGLVFTSTQSKIRGCNAGERLYCPHQMYLLVVM